MSETTALATKSTYLPPPDRGEWASMIEMANTLAKAQGFVPAHFYQQPYKILAAVLFGRDLGISATNALQHIIVIDGKATADAQLIGMLVRRAGHSIEDATTPEQSTVTITRGDDKTKHEVTFSMQDANRAGLVRAGGAWQKYPQAMLYARALTACARKGAQDALMGTIYTPEEIGANVNDEGNVVLPASAPTGEIPVAEASPASVAVLAEWREVADEGEILPPNIAGNSPAPASPHPVAQPVEAPTATANGKRRGRPMGSKNGPRDEQGAPSEQSEPTASPHQAPATTSASPAAFGDESPETVLNGLRRELRDHASRLRKYQYMEQAREVLPLEQWQREVERTLAIFVERKFGTDVRITDIEEAGLREAISDLKGFIAKYEAPADDDDIAPPAVEAEIVEQNLSEKMYGVPAGTMQPQPKAANSAEDTTVVSLHKPIVRNPVAAQRRDDPTHIDPRAALDRARLVADLRNRTTALLATKEGLISLSAKDEERLRGEADKTMERAAQGSFQRSLKDLDNVQLASLIERAKAAVAAAQ